MAPTASDISRSFQNLDKLDLSGRNYRTWSQRIKDAMIMLDMETAITANATAAAEVKVEKQVGAGIKQTLPHEIYATITVIRPHSS